jgi:hypothetical protein
MIDTLYLTSYKSSVIRRVALDLSLPLLAATRLNTEEEACRLGSPGIPKTEAILRHSERPQGCAMLERNAHPFSSNNNNRRSTE